MNRLIDQVDDAYNYFLEFRFEDLKEDDVYYISALMKYIEKLEAQVLNLKKETK